MQELLLLDLRDLQQKLKKELHKEVSLTPNLET